MTDRCVNQVKYWTNYNQVSDGLTFEELCGELRRIDPDNGKNIFWLMGQLKSGKFKLSELNQVERNLNLFLQNKGKLQQVDYDGLKQAVSKILSPSLEPMVSDDIVVLYDGNYGVLSIPKSKDASCKLGSGTKWCTSAKVAENKFDEYNKKGPLYVWLDRKLAKQKFQFHFETGQYMNEVDKPIENVQVFVMNNPVLNKFVKIKVKEFIDDGNAKALFSIAKDFNDYVTDKDVFEDIIATDPESAYNYANEIVGEWTKGEPVIATNPQTAYKYATKVLGRKWPEGEPAVLTDPRSSSDYAKAFYRNGWPIGEPVILRDAISSEIYAQHVLKRPWVEAEPMILTDAEASVQYAINVRKRPWPQAEPTILKSPEPAYLYTMAFKKKQGWHEAIPIILTDPVSSYFYASNIIGGKWPEGEPTIMKDPVASYNYAMNLMGRRWPEAEPTILKDSETTFLYARDVVKGPFPEGESVIQKNPEYAFEYARFVAKRPYKSRPTLSEQDKEMYDLFVYDFTRDEVDDGWLSVYRNNDGTLYRRYEEGEDLDTILARKDNLIWKSNDGEVLYINLIDGTIQDDYGDMVEDDYVFQIPYIVKAMNVDDEF